MVKHTALIPAAGIGERFKAYHSHTGELLPKQYTLLNGEAMLVHTLKALLRFNDFETIWVIVSPTDVYAKPMLASLFNQYPVRLQLRFIGGDTRADTVKAGLIAIQAYYDKDYHNNDKHWVWVHDAARPAVDLSSLNALKNTLNQAQPIIGALLAIPVSDTLKYSTDNLLIDKTLSRKGVFQAQTPQCFELNTLLQALSRNENNITITDEASAIEAIGLSPTLVLGHTHNFKVTYPEDAILMESVLNYQYLHPNINNNINKPSELNKMIPKIAIGEGMDVHALVEGRPLILGGVIIPHIKGLLGHSDADALLHAITDAILGAAGLGDIGRLFPDTDSHYQGADSQVLLKQAYSKVNALGWTVNNVDATIIAQSPKMSPYIDAMRLNIAQCLNISIMQVNVKAKTNERLGWLGREEGIETRAVALLLMQV